MFTFYHTSIVNFRFSNISTFEIVVVNSARVAFAVAVTYNRIFELFPYTWAFIKSEGTQDTLVVEVPASPPLPWLVPGKKIYDFKF